MSEKMAEEGAGPSGIVKFKDNFVKITTKDRNSTLFFASKAAELLACIISIVLAEYKSMTNSEHYLPPFKLLGVYNPGHKFGVVCIALGGFVLINLALLVSRLLGEPLLKKLLFIFSSLGAIFCLAAGIILIEGTDNSYPDSNSIFHTISANEYLFSGIFAIIAALIFAAEAVLTVVFK